MVVTVTAYANTFMRREIKYLLDEQMKLDILERISPYMTEDRYSNQTISSLYCDSDEDILIRTSLDKPVYKEKLRLRAYGRPEDDSRAFLEIKKKFDGIVYKRRAKMTYSQAWNYLVNGTLPDFPGYNEKQVMSEISYMIQRNKLKPKAAIFYDRRSFFGNENHELRLTLDGNVRYRLSELDLRNGTDGIQLDRQPFCVMEIKSADAVPLWLAGILSELEIYPGSFSKYGSVYREKLMTTHEKSTII
ncbi:MAG: polyphosphate polymerase domain-containing protein [Oscillospiraceae bacterium]|nr:polyphosphate polymerase domain-containing protein [Oscillospiraceae bacterium]